MTSQRRHNRMRGKKRQTRGRWTVQILSSRRQHYIFPLHRSDGACADDEFGHVGKRNIKIKILHAYASSVGIATLAAGCC